MIKIESVFANLDPQKKSKKSLFHDDKNWSRWRKITVFDEHIFFKIKVSSTNKTRHYKTKMPQKTWKESASA